ncbi:N-6 DNA methylase [Spirosoma luteum]|uniref:N-6 DNA methylase n=1 Tax=Spirosoma luteum TaxID=431553 RepID=UPI000365F14E|nr:N-6 DNA methylase [Spirosoma luteum]
MEVLDRHYTEIVFSELLINSISYHQPKSIVDLGIGNGSLTVAAYNKWNDASFWGCDIDLERIETTRTNLPFAQISKIDGLDVNSPFPLKVGTIDIAICNPPYYRVAEKEKYIKLFESVSLPHVDSLPFVTADLIFLANNLLLLKQGGQLGIIIPDGLVTSQVFEPVRQALLNKYTIKSIIELPSNIFKKTEAKTHILIIEKRTKINSYEVELLCADKQGICSHKVLVQSAMLYERMDYTYTNWMVNDRIPTNKNLRDINATIIRSNRTTKELNERNIEFLHSTSYNEGEILRINSSFDEDNRLIYAVDGDIIVTRVGKRCIGKVCLIEKGRIPISDCLFIIRVSKEYKNLVFSALISSSGKKWFEIVGHGVCSKVISRENLYSFNF